MAPPSTTLDEQTQAEPAAVPWPAAPTQEAEAPTATPAVVGPAAPPTPARPAWPALRLRHLSPMPRWQQAIAESLQAPPPEPRAVAAPHPGIAPEPIELALCAEGAARLSGPGAQWLLLDGQGSLLHPERPLWSAISRGQGIALQLWQRPHPGAPWQCLRRAHAAADTRPGHALPALAAQASRLVQQARIDLALGLGLDGVAMPLPQAPPFPRGLTSAIGGQWRAWRRRLRAQFTTEAWRLGIVEAPIGQWMASGGRLPVHWLEPAGPGIYDADPMGVPGNPEVLLCETFDERIGVGFIDRLTLAPDRRVAARERLPLDDGRHVSFPMMVEIQGERYGIVESAARGDCVLHRVDDEGRWHRIATLFQDRPMADPVLFHQAGRWWLAATDLRIGGQDNLCLFHAVRPEGPWMPHANNPVKLDIGSARMAGPVFRLPTWPPRPPGLPVDDGADGPGDVLIRPGQDCLGGYGRAVVLHRITELTPTHYAEERLLRIEPQDLAAAGAPALDGVHTACPWGDRTLIDAKRHVVDLQALRRKLRHRLGWGAGA